MNLKYATQKASSLRPNSDYAGSAFSLPNLKARLGGRFQSHAKGMAAYWFAFQAVVKRLVVSDMSRRVLNNPSNLRSRTGNAVEL